MKVTRRFQFAMGHTLHQHEGACANLHGHNYVAFVTVETPDLDPVGRVVDFGVIKDRVGAYINAEFDHRFLVYEQDPRATGLYALDSTVNVVGYNPTAENLANALLRAAQGVIETPLHVSGIVLWETENAYASI